MEDPDDDSPDNEVEQPREYVPRRRSRYGQDNVGKGIQVSFEKGKDSSNEEGWKGWLLKLTMLGIAGLFGWIANEITSLRKDTAAITTDLAAIKATQVATITAQAVRDAAEEQRLTTLERRVFLEPYEKRNTK